MASSHTTPAAGAEGTGSDEGRPGGCLCGRIRFTARGPAVFPHTCACPHCQKLGGTPVMWWVGFESVVWTGQGGEPTWFETFPGQAKRGFCPTCGSSVAAIDSDIPEVGINVTALDDTSGKDLVPIHASFCDNAVHWLTPVLETEHNTVTSPGGLHDS
ncbi:GFA family protein [Streptomyces sp. NRRL F-5650]|uniref:GFA family protein n=1 Tax=Streptomyces sp. NRRL F-5650 TaxID=1463868 RepID=UPI00099C5A66|nr:GFA family protein [Streptomyces sp. NRRL F-5650]